MALEYVVLEVFFMLIGFGSLYLNFKREAVFWSILATIIFVTGVYFGITIPFSLDASGGLLMTSANVMLSGVNLIFAFFSLFRSVYMAIMFFGK